MARIYRADPPLEYEADLYSKSGYIRKSVPCRFVGDGIVFEDIKTDWGTITRALIFGKNPKWKWWKFWRKEMVLIADIDLTSKVAVISKGLR